ncbi:MAG: response regulator [Candidatus Bathyarchaeum sp.]|nr:MAG: response regulator [Candidatus Bathyarchaeum sp.]
MQASNKKERIKVLFVDDDVEFLKSAKQCLKLQGAFDVESASSADEVLEKMKKKPDVIVCDINMPDINGIEFLKALRESGNNTPFIVFTVTRDKETALKAFNAGANGFVGKSGDPAVVFSTLKRCIEEPLTTNSK